MVSEAVWASIWACFGGPRLRHEPKNCLPKQLWLRIGAQARILETVELKETIFHMVSEAVSVSIWTCFGGPTLRHERKNCLPKQL